MVATCTAAYVNDQNTLFNFYFKVYVLFTVLR